MHKNLPPYFAIMKPTLPTVGMKLEFPCSSIFRHTLVEHFVWFCPIYLQVLNKDTRFATIIERVDTDSFRSFKFYLKRQLFESF